jgi:hypothetical protein
LKIAHIMANLPVPTQTGEVAITEQMRDNAASIFQQLAEETEALVVKHWLAIKRVAEALVHRDLLLPDDLDSQFQT